MFEKLKKDIEAVRERDPAARNSFEVLMTSSGLHAILLHRPANWLYKHDHYLCARVVSQLARFATGIEIHPGAKIGAGVLIDHGMGVVIGETAEIGDGCTIYQGVTLGGTGKDKGKRHPTLGKNVTVGCGAKILGPFKVGDGAKVAANAVLLESIPANATAVGVPARVAHVGGNKVATLDHVHLPDPVAQELCRLQSSFYKLERRVVEIEKNGGSLTAKTDTDKDVDAADAIRGKAAAPRDSAAGSAAKVPRPMSGKMKASTERKKTAASKKNDSRAISASMEAVGATEKAMQAAPIGVDASTAQNTQGADMADGNIPAVQSAVAEGVNAPAAQNTPSGVTADAKASSAPSRKRSTRGNQSHHPVPTAAELMLEREKSAASERGARQAAANSAAELPVAAEMEHPVPTAFVQK